MRVEECVDICPLGGFRAERPLDTVAAVRRGADPDGLAAGAFRARAGGELADLSRCHAAVVQADEQQHRREGAVRFDLLMRVHREDGGTLRGLARFTHLADASGGVACRSTTLLRTVPSFAERE
jgi:hypothetical protein